MQIPEEQKLDVILAQLQERYHALHKMRDRSMQFALWILGLGLGMGWLLLSEKALTSPQQGAITLLLLLLGLATLWFIRGIQRGFETTRQIVIRLEKMLELYERGSYGQAEAVLPREYTQTKKKSVGHFETLYGIMIVVFLTLLLLTWMNPCRDPSGDSSGVCEPQQVETCAKN